MEKKEIVAQLLKNGAKSIKGLKVKNVTISQQENYVRVAITLDKEVDAYKTEDGTSYEPGKTKVIFVSMFSITSILKDNDDAAFAVNHFLAHPESMSVVLSRATIDIVQETVPVGTEYKNPWSSSDTSTVFDHDTIINHLVDIRLSDFAIRKIDKLADSLLGF